MSKIKQLIEEDVSLQKECNLCKESLLQLGDKTNYGAIIVYKKNGFFATLSPKTGGNPKNDFTIQLMTDKHYTHFSQLDDELAQSYGLAFARISKAITEVLAEKGFDVNAKTRDSGSAVAMWGKCTTWQEKKEHFHIKLYPFRDKLGQPCPADSSWGRKEVFDNEYIKMEPIKKRPIEKERFEYLSKRFIELLK